MLGTRDNDQAPQGARPYIYQQLAPNGKLELDDVLGRADGVT